MAANINDKFTKTFNSVNPNVAKVASSRAAGATVLTCDNLAGWPTDTKVHFSTYTVDTENRVVSGTQIDWEGIVNGNNIGSLNRKAGAVDGGNSINDIVEMNPTASWANDLATGLLVNHDADGKISVAGATRVASILPTGSVKSSSLGLSKTTDANGWTIYDFGTWKEYRRQIAWTVNNWANNAEINLTQNASLPVGMTNLTGMHVDASLTMSVYVSAPTSALQLNSTGNNTNINFYAANRSGGTIPGTTTGTVNVSIIPK